MAVRPASYYYCGKNSAQQKRSAQVLLGALFFAPLGALFRSGERFLLRLVWSHREGSPHLGAYAKVPYCLFFGVVSRHGQWDTILMKEKVAYCG